MARSLPLPLPRTKTAAKTLVQQQADFTAEGSPPPGRVAKEVPVTSPVSVPVRRQGFTPAKRS